MSKSRPLQIDLAPAYNALLTEYPPTRDSGRTEERAFSLVKDALAALASDIHVEPGAHGARIRFRIDGRLHDVAAIPGFSALRLVNYFRVAADIDPDQLATAQDGRVTLRMGKDDDEKVELRLACAPSVAGDRLTLRLLNHRQHLFELTQLGLSAEDLAQIEAWIDSLSGMVVVAGPTGSGKTSTLYAFLDHLRHLDRNVVTIEDPVEHPVDGVTQMQVNHQRGFTFTAGMRGMLRMDPDILMLGEIRDKESLAIALDASATGRVLLTSLHARDAAGAITALRNYGADDADIATAVELVIAQRLVRRLCPKCRVYEAPGESDARFLQQLGVEKIPTKTWQAVGCAECSGVGFSGRVGLFEIWRLNRAEHERLGNHISEIDLRRYLRQSAIPHMLNDGLLKCERGETALSELRPLGSVAIDPTHRQNEHKRSRM